ncbi:MAG TPA: SRPBCC domain-containing protein [Acidimicrobiales bacterium]|jgi:uncharacterized protein YndB with AHSA1/START domain
MADNKFSYTLTRTLDAPVAQVWKAWTTPEDYAVWANAVPGSVELDVRSGGPWKAVMKTPDGSQFPMTGSYVEVVENQRLVVGMDVPGLPEPATMGMELADHGDKTVITLNQVCSSEEERAMAEEGSNMLLDGLVAFLAKA